MYIIFIIKYNIMKNIWFVSKGYTYYLKSILNWFYDEARVNKIVYIKSIFTFILSVTLRIYDLCDMMFNL